MIFINWQIYQQFKVPLKYFCTFYTNVQKSYHTIIWRWKFFIVKKKKSMASSSRRKDRSLYQISYHVIDIFYASLYDFLLSYITYVSLTLQLLLVYIHTKFQIFVVNHTFCSLNSLHRRFFSQSSLRQKFQHTIICTVSLKCSSGSIFRPIKPL